LLELVAALLAVMRSINDFFDDADALEVPGDTHLLKEIHSPLHTRELALALGSKGAVTLNTRLERSLRRGERSGRRRNEGGGGNVGVIIVILLVLASSLSAALLLAVLAVARQPTSLLLLLLALLALLLLLLLLPSLALLLVELGVFALVLDRGDAVGILMEAFWPRLKKETVPRGKQCSAAKPTTIWHHRATIRAESYVGPWKPL
jgi:hypothetical protein